MLWAQKARLTAWTRVPKERGGCSRAEGQGELPPQTPGQREGRALVGVRSGSRSSEGGGPTHPHCRTVCHCSRPSCRRHARRLPGHCIAGAPGPRAPPEESPSDGPVSCASPSRGRPGTGGTGPERLPRAPFGFRAGLRREVRSGGFCGGSAQKLRSGPAGVPGPRHRRGVPMQPPLSPGGARRTERWGWAAASGRPCATAASRGRARRPLVAVPQPVETRGPTIPARPPDFC